MLDESIDQLLAEATRQGKEAAWDAGFRAGQSYGAAYERHDPGNDPGWDEPEKPRNPYFLPGASHD